MVKFIPDKDNIAKLARELYEKDREYWDPIFDKARQDLYFLSDADDAQWEKNDYASRRTYGRATITVDKLNQFVHQVANDIRMKTPSINIIPSDQEAAPETAKILKGLIKNIEFQSKADIIYDSAALFAIKSSIGFFRIDHEFCEDGTFNQKLVIKPVVNPQSVYMDSDFIYPDGSDAEHVTFIESISLSEFEERWPGKNPTDFCEPKKKITGKKNNDQITVAEFFRVVKTKKKIKAIDNGMGQEIQPYQEGDEENPNFKKSREIVSRKVERYWLSGDEVLEKTSFPGIYVPIVPVFGEEAWIDGRRELYSLIRRAKGAQMMHNYFKSLEVETLRKQPIAPVMAAEGQLDDYMDDWKNPSKAAVLVYKQTDLAGNNAPMPNRLAPPGLPSGFAQAAAMSVDDIKSSLGIYNASLGQASNETSGIAINARKAEGDTATLHFGDNQSRAIAQCGTILVHAIPEIYDVARILFITGEEGEHKQVGVNGAYVEGQQEHYDLTKGQYSVEVTTGTPFATVRQETANFYQQFMQVAPQYGILMADLMLKNSDIAGAEEAASRMKRIIDMQNPGLIESDNEEEQQANAQVQAIQQQAQQIIQTLQQQIAELQQELKSKNDEMQLKFLDIQAKAQSDQGKLEIANSKNENDATFKALELSLKNQELQLKEQQVAGNLAIQAQSIKIEQLINSVAKIAESIPNLQIGMPHGMANRQMMNVAETSMEENHD